ncbi:MAG: LytTR family DNA-binding domain-containing protein [Bacteroidota bacterium]
MYLEAYGAYVKIYLTNKMIITHDKLSHFEQKLPSSDFIRVHKSFIVALRKVARIEGNRLFLAAQAIPIGGTYRKGVKTWVKS